MVEDDVVLGSNVDIPFPELVNIYGCHIFSGTFIGPFVEIQRGAIVGKNCRIQSHTFICDRVIIENNVFVGHGVIFCNDKHPPSGRLEPVLVKGGAAIGNRATILPGVTIGRGAMVGGGAVVARDVPDGVTVVGNPARELVRD